MNDNTNSKRLDKIEPQLTSKLWAIRLANEMRRYPSQKDFQKAIGKGTYRESPSIKPFYALRQQAHERWPENYRKEVALNRKLRMEFQALKMLINNINSTIERKAETNRLKVAVQLSKLQTLILEDSLAYSGVFETESARASSFAT